MVEDGTFVQELKIKMANQNNIIPKNIQLNIKHKKQNEKCY